MAARNKVFFMTLILASSACVPLGEQSSDTLIELRRLPELERKLTFHQLDNKTKIELFFQSSRIHPPYTGLDNAIAEENKIFRMKLRDELDRRGGVPEVLSFMGIVFDMKNRDKLSHDEIQEMRIDGICQLAIRSNYCPGLEAKILSPKSTEI